MCGTKAEDESERHPGRQAQPRPPLYTDPLTVCVGNGGGGRQRRRWESEQGRVCTDYVENTVILLHQNLNTQSCFFHHINPQGILKALLVLTIITVSRIMIIQLYIHRRQFMPLDISEHLTKQLFIYPTPTRVQSLMKLCCTSRILTGRLAFSS